MRLGVDGGRLKGFGFVQFENHDSVRKAMLLNGSPLLGRALIVDADYGNMKAGYKGRLADDKEGEKPKSKYSDGVGQKRAADAAAKDAKAAAGKAGGGKKMKLL